MVFSHAKTKIIAIHFRMHAIKTMLKERTKKKSVNFNKMFFCLVVYWKKVKFKTEMTISETCRARKKRRQKKTSTQRLIRSDIHFLHFHCQIMTQHRFRWLFWNYGNIFPPIERAQPQECQRAKKKYKSYIDWNEKFRSELTESEKLLWFVQSIVIFCFPQASSSKFIYIKWHLCFETSSNSLSFINMSR